MARERRDRLKWLKTLFHIQGLGWQIPSIVGFVVVAAGIVWLWLREPAGDALDTVADFVAADVNVWHLLLTIGAGVAVSAAIVARRALQTSTAEDTIRTSCPDEILHFDVLWPITTLSDGLKPTGFEVGEPMCPKCRSTLGYYPEDVFANNSRPEPLHSLWMHIAADELLFECFRDGSKFDLRHLGRDMEGLVAIVETQAWGEYRSSHEAATKKRKRSVNG